MATVKPSWWLPIIFATGLSLVGTLYMEYTRSGKENAARISALEAHRDGDQRQLSHIQQQVDKLVEWAIGD